MRISVTKQPIDPGPAGWRDLLQAPASFPRLEQNMMAEWVVIGAGFAGLSAARRLAQRCPADRIVVLDAKQVAEGPAGRNSGFMIDLPHDLASEDYGGAVEADKVLIEDNRYAIDFAAEMAEDFGLGADVFDRSGKINGAATAKGHSHNVDYASHLAGLDEESELYDAQTMKEITGTDYYQSGLFTKGTAMIQPAAYVLDIAHGMSSNRLQIFENSGVTGLKRNGAWQVETASGTVTTPNVLLAVNGHLNSFGYMKRRLMHVFTYASLTRPLTEEEVKALGGKPVWGLTPADPLGTTVRRLSGASGDRILVRNRFTFDPSMEVDAARMWQIAKNHDAALCARFPMLKHVEMAWRWGGRLCLSRNSVGIVQELEDGLFAACCQNGLGTTRGTLAGILAADLATGHASDRLDRAIHADAPQKLPPNWITKPAANALLRFQEYRAGKEV